ncbi:MAG: TonB-dependent receptor [Bacteroidota bacterium]
MRLRALLFLLAASAAHGQAAPDSTLDAVTVTAAREALPTAEAPARVTVVDRAALDATASVSVADALQARAPVHVRRYGPSGLASVTIRGASSSQALVLVDGQRLTDPQLGQVDLSLLPTSLLEAVEVLSGPASGLYGSDAVGGVIHLRPPAASGTGARLTTEAGPWGERRASGLATVQAGRVRALVAAEAGATDDDYSFADRSRIDGRRVTRQGWDAGLASVYASASAGTEAGGAGLSVWAADAERGLGGDGVLGERQWDRRLRLGATAHRAAGAWRVEAVGAVQRASLRYANPFPAPADRPDAIDDTGRTTTAHLDLRAATERAGWTWTAALAAGLGRGDHPSLAEAAEDRFAGAAVSGQGRLGGVTLFPSLRLDAYAPAGQPRRLGVGPQLGANVALTDAVRLKASAARAFRMPTLNDRFWQPGGNPDLRPEAAWSADGGLVWSGRGAHAEAGVFATWARDQIVWSPTAGGFWAPDNVARTRSLGAEASARAVRAVRLGARDALVEAGAVGTLVDARDLDADRRLRYVPAWTLKAWSGLAVGAVRLDAGARLVGRRFTTASESQALPAHAVVDAQASVRRRLGGAVLTVALAAENLTGVQYEVVQSFPMPPRHARVRLTLQSL